MNLILSLNTDVLVSACAAASKGIQQFHYIKAEVLLDSRLCFFLSCPLLLLV